MEATGVDSTGMATMMIFLILALLCLNPSVLLFLILGVSFWVAKPMESPAFSEQSVPPQIHQAEPQAVPHSYLQQTFPFIPDTWQQWQQAGYQITLPQRSK